MKTLTEQLKELGFDCKEWKTGLSWVCGIPMLQITDATGITFYMPTDATLDQCLERYEQKLTAFRLADNK